MGCARLSVYGLAAGLAASAFGYRETYQAATSPVDLWCRSSESVLSEAVKALMLGGGDAKGWSAQIRDCCASLEKALEGSVPYGAIAPEEEPLAQFGVPLVSAGRVDRDAAWVKDLVRADVAGDSPVFDRSLGGGERKRALLRTLERLNGAPVELTVLNDQPVITLTRKSADGASAVVAAFNPGPDRFHDFQLLLARRPEKVEILQPDGIWLERTFDYYKDGTLLLPSDTPNQGVYILRVTFGRPKPVPVVSGKDSDWIDAAIARAVADGSRKVTVPRKDDGTPWFVTRAILLPDDFTLELDDCTVQLAPGVRDNLIRNAGAVDTFDVKPNRNITVRGKGRAVLCGGLDSHYEPNRSGDINGWTTIGVLFSRVDGFTIENIVLRETQAWGMSMERCANGRIADIRLEDTNLMYNQDGVDLRWGCHDIVIENISGVCGDDAVALTGLAPSSRALATTWAGSGTERRPMEIGRERGVKEVRPEDAIHHVTIRNVRARSAGGHSVIRLLPQDGVEMHHIAVSNVVDTTRENEVRAAGTIRIGDTHYWTIRPARAGDLHHITIENVEAKGKVGLWIKCPIVDSAIRSVTVPEGTRKYDLQSSLSNVILD